MPNSFPSLILKWAQQEKLQQALTVPAVLTWQTDDTVRCQALGKSQAEQGPEDTESSF
jgi:hypothetical protein